MDHGYRYRMGAIAAAFVLFLALPVAVTVLGPGLSAIASALAVAFMGFGVTILLVAQLEATEGTADGTSIFESIILRDEVASEFASARWSLDMGLGVASLSTFLAGLAFLIALLGRPPILALDLFTLGIAAAALLFATHSWSRLRIISRKSERTVWRRPLTRVGIFASAAGVLTASTGLVTLLNAVAARRVFVNDWVAFMTAFFTLYTVLDARGATIRAAATSVPEG